MLLKFRISIHAPTRGATSFDRFLNILKLYFNPRSHERSDHLPHCRVYHKVFISIHAPTRGATKSQFLQMLILPIFQSTLPREERPSSTTAEAHTSVFQSTLPREERRYTRAFFPILHNISIHAPTRGATAILHKKFVYFYTIPTINI